SGFVCFVPRSSVTPVHMSVEDAAKIIISAGMGNPETQARLKKLARKGDAVPKPPRLEAAQKPTDPSTVHPMARPSHLQPIATPLDPAPGHSSPPRSSYLEG